MQASSKACVAIDLADSPLSLELADDPLSLDSADNPLPLEHQPPPLPATPPQVRRAAPAPLPPPASPGRVYSTPSLGVSQPSAPQARTAQPMRTVQPRVLKATVRRYTLTASGELGVDEGTAVLAASPNSSGGFNLIHVVPSTPPWRARPGVDCKLAWLHTAHPAFIDRLTFTESADEEVTDRCWLVYWTEVLGASAAGSVASSADTHDLLVFESADDATALAAAVGCVEPAWAKEVRGPSSSSDCRPQPQRLQGTAHAYMPTHLLT